MTKTFEVSLADRRGDRKAHKLIKAESASEAIIEAEIGNPGLLVNKITEMVEHVYKVGLTYSQGTTRMYNTIKAYSESDAAAIARRRNPGYDVTSIEEIE